METEFKKWVNERSVEPSYDAIAEWWLSKIDSLIASKLEEKVRSIRQAVQENASFFPLGMRAVHKDILMLKVLSLQTPPKKEDHE